MGQETWVDQGKDGEANNQQYGIGLQWSVRVGYTLVTLPRIVTPYRDSVDGTLARVTHQKVGYAVTLRAFSVCCRYLAVASKG